MLTHYEDSLNYHLIMEGFYYDAEIEHITEIIKNVLYFAVLEEETNKILKSTHDTYYFNIDDELVYINYYYDFGPLNLSCVYKYCCNLNNFLQYSQGIKRVVHYTTANPMKRVNAAFLMGCYAVIYLKMDPKEIYRILLNAGGQFKAFVDASQGISQYTIHLLDCLQAIQKALLFNFYNFDDFNMEEYDLFDKLQNGDMNWLLPRKFLAFIGPTDNELMNGHPPDFYIKYFLENDVKTVVRLNNKMYDSSVFTRVGIQHHELFFPDGTVPTKQILLQFLNLAENARAAIAVHCKAGLGRTGSLIGAYIIKHYRMSARETIAWMRICRPGSVIGQQQGWLEKIESWLWRQGNLYRLQHFGEGDKIPHHKYGIYSKQWPKEREKLIRHVQRKRFEVQSPWSKVKPETIKRVDNSIPPFDCPVHTCVKKSLAKSQYTGQKSPLTQTVEDKCKKVSKILSKIQRTPQAGNRTTKSVPKHKKLYRIQDVSLFNAQYEEENDVKTKHQHRKEKVAAAEGHTNKIVEAKHRRYINTEPPYSEVDELETRTRPEENGRIRSRSKKRNQSANRESQVEHRRSTRLKKPFVESLEQTQGDKLNDIKAKRLTAYVEGEGGEHNIKHCKPRMQYFTTTAMDICNKPEAHNPKNRQIENMQPSKRTHLNQMYALRN